MFRIKSVLVLLTLVSYAHQADYCSQSLCKRGKHHIACDNSGHFSDACQQPSLVPMTQQLQRIILNKHNYLRNKIASGREHKFESAAKMPTLRWNDELAYFAQLNVLQCRMHHDQCRNTHKFKFCGQNLALQSSPGSINIKKTIDDMIWRWYYEKVQASMSDIKRFQVDNVEKIGHFIAMVQDKTSDVGCAISSYKSGDYTNLLLACNYSFTYLNHKSVYTPGPSCSQCRRGCNRQYLGLCNPQERVNANP